MTQARPSLMVDQVQLPTWWRLGNVTPNHKRQDNCRLFWNQLDVVHNNPIIHSMNAQKRKANNIDDIDVDAELEAGPSNNLFQKRGRTGTAEAGSRAGSIAPAGTGAPADGEGGEDDEDEAPAMEDDDYSAQLSWQSQSKENMKYVVIFCCRGERANDML